MPFIFLLTTFGSDTLWKGAFRLFTLEELVTTIIAGGAVGTTVFTLEGEREEISSTTSPYREKELVWLKENSSPIVATFLLIREMFFLEELEKEKDAIKDVP